MKTKNLKSAVILLSVILGLTLLIAFFSAAGQAVQKRDAVKEMFATETPPPEGWCLTYQHKYDEVSNNCMVMVWPSSAFENDPKDHLYNCGRCNPASGFSCQEPDVACQASCFTNVLNKTGAEREAARLPFP